MLELANSGWQTNNSYPVVSRSSCVLQTFVTVELRVHVLNCIGIRSTYFTLYCVIGCFFLHVIHGCNPTCIFMKIAWMVPSHRFSTESHELLLCCSMCSYITSPEEQLLRNECQFHNTIPISRFTAAKVVRPSSNLSLSSVRCLLSKVPVRQHQRMTIYRESSASPLVHTTP